ncbi:MAG: GNAT family N-acetyltransferase [Sphingomonadales bacterium]
MGDKLSENIRPLTADDLDRVIEIDQEFTGRKRRGFFEKRLAAALAEPHAFLYVGCEQGGELKGFVLARILEGEFGQGERIAVLDGLAVDPNCMGKGMGRALMLGLENVLRRKGIREIQTQADWTNFSLLRFLSYWGFGLAPRIVLERACRSDRV